MCKAIKNWFLEKYEVDLDNLAELDAARIFEDARYGKTEINPLHKQFLANRENLQDLISMYKRLWCDSGLSLGALMEGENGQQEIVQIMHRYSMQKLDPVWNWRKEQMIRKKFKSFLANTRLYNICEPVHIVLTLPRINGLYHTEEGEKLRYYGSEIKRIFNLVRKTAFWKKSVYGGEYGLETKTSPTKENGLHIHIHSLTFLNKGVNLNDFRENLKAAWHEYANYEGYERLVAEQINTDSSLTSEQKAEKIKRGVAPILWAEHLYFNKKDTSGAWLCESLTDKVIEIDAAESIKWDDYEFITEELDGKRTVRPYRLNADGEIIVRRKKFYVHKEAELVQADESLTDNEKQDRILEMYLHGCLECIKYHFKQDSFFLKDSKEYDIELMAEILRETRSQRLYDRFGKLNGAAKDVISELEIYRLSFSSVEKDIEMDDMINYKLCSGLELTDKEKRYYKIYLLNRETSGDECPDLPLIEDFFFTEDKEDFNDSSDFELTEEQFEQGEEMFAAANREPVNPFTGKATEKYKLVLYRPEMIHYAGKSTGYQRMSSFEGKLVYVEDFIDMDSIVRVVASTPLQIMAEQYPELNLN